MNQDTTSLRRVVTIKDSDVITGAYLRLDVKRLVLSTSVSMSENNGRWKPKGGLADPLRDYRSELRVSETLHGTAKIYGSKILAIGQDHGHSQKLDLTLQSQHDFDGGSWEHSRGWLKFMESGFDEQCWNCWFNVPLSIFQSLASAVRRKSVCKMSLHADLRTHGNEFFNGDNKIDVEGVEVFVTSINWDEESGLK